MTALVVVLTVVVALLALLVAGLLRSHATILRRLAELDGSAGLTSGPADPRQPAAQPPVRTVEGIPAPLPDPTIWVSARDITGRTPAGESVVLRTAGGGQDTILAFLSSGCSTCLTFWREFGDGTAILPAGARLIVVTKGPEAESLSEVARLAPAGVDLVMSSEAWSDYRVPGSPFVVAVDGRTGRVNGEGTGQSWRQVAALLAQSTGDASFLTGGPAVRKPTRDATREAKVDAELLAAGILPGDPSLYPAPTGDTGSAGEQGW